MTKARTLLLTSVLALAALCPHGARAQGIIGPPRNQEFTVVGRHFLTAAAASGVVNGVVLADPAVVRAVNTYAYVVSGGGAGNTLFRVTDGTNVCDCTLLCTTSNSIGSKRVACSGACAYAAGATVTFSIVSSTCTTTQPSLLSIEVRGTLR